MPKYIGEISRESKDGNVETVKFPFAASDWLIANDFVEAIAQNMPEAQSLKGDKYKYETTASEVDEK